jgi:hypothetical protein
MLQGVILPGVYVIRALLDQVVKGSGRGFNSAKTSSGKPSKRPSQRDTNSLGIFGK